MSQPPRHDARRAYLFRACGCYLRDIIEGHGVDADDVVRTARFNGIFRRLDAPRLRISLCVHCTLSTKTFMTRALALPVYRIRYLPPQTTSLKASAKSRA